MPTRATQVLFDANDPSRLADFWAAALGWERDDDEDEPAVMPAGFSYPSADAMPLIFLPVSEPKTVKDRVHLDLATQSAEEQAETVRRLLGLGATRADIGQGDVAWEVMADPEGNEFCVLEPRPVYADTGPVAAVLFDCADPQALARFWGDAAGWTMRESTEEFASLRSPHDTGPFLEFLLVNEPKVVKNRLHVDVAPLPDGDQGQEVARLKAAGAVPVDIGQGEVSWVVLADPEGNEFCVLTPR
jgi:predicted enzyme related to lactoylglutathione lyase